jgi:3-hydroxyisobutyrate dehydrogenase-like beta-hydroxyacid dehydrogenase
MANRIAFLGLGAMGVRMAVRLIEAGHSLTVWNRDPEKARALRTQHPQIVVANNPREAVNDADIAIAMVRDDEAACGVWNDARTGALGGMKPETLAIESSTVTPARAAAFAAAARARGVQAIEAPVIGSRPHAQAGQLIVVAGGEPTAIERAKPVLGAFATAVHFVGPIGAGATVKLVVNTLFASQLATMAELLGVLRASNADLTPTLAAVSGLPVVSPAAKAAMETMHTTNFAPLFPIELVAKDMGYARALGKSLGLRMPMTQAVEAVLCESMNRGYAHENATALVKLYAPDALKMAG